MVETVRWPRAVYFDASVLRQLPHDLSSPDLARLKGLSEKLNIGLFVPEIAVLEWVIHHQETVKKIYEGVASNARTIGKYLQRNPLTFEYIEDKDLLAEVNKAQLSYLREAGITVLRTPDIDLGRLIKMAVRREKPFQEQDKGFRDTLIALTIAEHAKAFAGHYILIAAADKIFRAAEVMDQWREAGVEPLVASTLADAVVQVDDLIDIAVKSYLDHEAARMREFLVMRQEVIFDHVLKNAEVSEAFISGRLGSNSLFGTIERVLQVRPLEITRVSKGWVTGAVEADNGHIPVTFEIAVAFDIVLSTYPLSELLFGPKIPLEGPVDLRGKPILPPAARSIEQDTTVERTITVEATIEENEKGEFSNLCIKKILTY